MPTRARAFPSIVAVLLALGSFQFATSISAQVQRGATMTVLRGEVAVVRADGSAIQPAPSGTTVDTGDQIRTLNRAGALITFFAGTEIELGEGTILEIDTVTRDGDRVNVSLKQVAGVTLNRIQTLASGSSYQIDAGGAVAIVRGTTFALAGPTPTSVGNVVALACLEDCGPQSTFGGCAMQPFMGIGVVVAQGKQASGCQTWAIGRNEGYFDAAVSGITTGEQAFTSGNPGQQNPGAVAASGKPNESNSHTAKDREREEDENAQCQSYEQPTTPGGVWEALALTGAGGAPGQVGLLLSPWFLLGLGRARRTMRAAARPWRRNVWPTILALALAVALLGQPGTFSALATSAAGGQVATDQQLLGADGIVRAAPAAAFTQCPPIGLSPSCGISIVINADGSVSVSNDPSVPPYDGAEDTLVGVVNNSSATIFSLPLTSNTDIFGFDGDGICTVTPRPAGCPFGPTGYEGPNITFSNISTNGQSGTVNFTGGLKPGGSAFFGLEEALTATNITPAAPSTSSTSATAPPTPTPTQTSTSARRC